MTNVDKLEAGRILDAMIAEKVMGLKNVCQCPLSDFTNDECNTCGGAYREEYSTDIAAAWEVVKKIGEFRGGPHDLYKPIVRLEYFEHDGIANVSIGKCKSMDTIVVDVEVWEAHGEPGANEAMCLAICRAALKAVGA